MVIDESVAAKFLGGSAPLLRFLGGGLKPLNPILYAYGQVKSKVKHGRLSSSHNPSAVQVAFLSKSQFKH